MYGRAINSIPATSRPSGLGSLLCAVGRTSVGTQLPCLKVPAMIRVALVFSSEFLEKLAHLCRAFYVESRTLVFNREPLETQQSPRARELHVDSPSTRQSPVARHGGVLFRSAYALCYCYRTYIHLTRVFSARSGSGFVTSSPNDAFSEDSVMSSSCREAPRSRTGGAAEGGPR